MNNDFQTIDQPDLDEVSARQMLRTVVQYLRLVYRHRLIAIGFVAAAVFIGVVHFKRTPSRYEASASMMIRHVAASTDLEDALATHGLLASYKQLLLSDVVLQNAVGSLATKPPELRDADPVSWPRALRSMLAVTFDPDENIVEVSCRSQDPESTVNVIQALSIASEKFIDEDRNGMSGELLHNLEAERKKVEELLQTRQRDLLEARKASGEISTLNSDGEAHPVINRVNELSSQLTAARTRRVELASMSQSVNQVATTRQDLSQLIPIMESIAGPETVQQIPGIAGVDQDVIAGIESDLSVVDSKLQTLGRHLGSQHPKIISLLTQKKNLKQRLTTTTQANRNRFAGGFYDPQIAQWMVNLVTTEFNQALQHEHLITQEYDLAKQAALDLNDRLAEVQMATRELDSLQRRHTYLLNQLNDIDIGQVNSSFRVTHLNRPLLPTQPVSPILAQNVAISCVLGMICAFATIFVIDLIDDRLRTPEDVQNQLAMPILGVIRPLPEHDQDDHHIYVHGHPLSVQTECFRTIRTAISLSDSDTRCIAITSSEQSEGKTTLTSNLAATFAQTGNRTLLIDADMRRPGLSKLLEIRGNGGLSEILRANDNVPEMCRERIVSTEVDGLDVLPCGPRMMNAGVLLSMPSLAAILDWAVSEYDQVMVDCPPTLPVSDATIVGNYVDGIVFLLNPEKTHRRSALRAVEQLRSVGMNLLGVVTNTSSEAHDGAYGYGYGYGQEYTYGHDEHDDDDESYVTVPFQPASDTARPYSLLSDSNNDETSTADVSPRRAA